MYKTGVNIKIRWGNGSPEGLDRVTQHCSLMLVVPVYNGAWENYAFLCWVLQNGTWYDWECIFLMCLRGGESLSLLLTSTLLCEILYIMTRRVSLRRSSRLCHLKWCSMPQTLDVFRFLLVKYLAALRWTISILLMSDLGWGSYTEQAYSSDGLTNDL